MHILVKKDLGALQKASSQKEKKPRAESVVLERVRCSKAAKDAAPSGLGHTL